MDRDEGHSASARHGATHTAWGARSAASACSREHVPAGGRRAGQHRRAAGTIEVTPRGTRQQSRNAAALRHTGSGSPGSQQVIRRARCWRVERGVDRGQDDGRAPHPGWGAHRALRGSCEKKMPYDIQLRSLPEGGPPAAGTRTVSRPADVRVHHGSSNASGPSGRAWYSAGVTGRKAEGQRGCWGACTRLRHRARRVRRAQALRQVCLHTSALQCSSAGAPTQQGARRRAQTAKALEAGARSRRSVSPTDAEAQPFARMTLWGQHAHRAGRRARCGMLGGRRAAIRRAARRGPRAL